MPGLDSITGGGSPTDMIKHLMQMVKQSESQQSGQSGQSGQSDPLAQVFQQLLQPK